jgi:hypothetical protein
MQNDISNIQPDIVALINEYIALNPYQNTSEDSRERVNKFMRIQHLQTALKVLLTREQYHRLESERNDYINGNRR